MNKNHLHSPFENFMYYFAIILGLTVIAARVIQIIITSI
jgi:hypothetical protein